MQNVPMMPPPKQGMPTWLIAVLVIGGLVVVLIGTLGVLAIFGTRKYIAAAKGAEALNGVGQIARSAQAVYDPAHGPEALCTSASSPVPSSIASVTGKKYQSAHPEWMVDSSTNGGFACLGFEMTMPQYFQYDYRLTGKGTDVGDEFHAIARGDLDGDGVVSIYDLSGKISGPDVVTIATTPTITNDGE
ncbi:MAG TPA: hypothetical protein VF407_06660 [Polyangiaceae bacterium]